MRSAFFWTAGNKGEIHVSTTCPEKDSLEVLLERARRRPMDQKERVAQRRSFAFGNAAFENPRITRQMIEDEERKMNLADE